MKLAVKASTVFFTFSKKCSFSFSQKIPGGVLSSYMGDIGMCCHKEYDFLAVLALNRISILVILVINRVWFLGSGPHNPKKVQSGSTPGQE